MKKTKSVSIQETKRKLDEQIGVLGCSDNRLPYLAVFKQPAVTTTYGSNTQQVSFESANIKEAK